MNSKSRNQIYPTSIVLASVGVLIGFGGIRFDANVHTRGWGKLLTVISAAAIVMNFGALWASYSGSRKATITLTIVAAALLVFPVLALLLALHGFGVPT